MAAAFATSHLSQCIHISDQSSAFTAEPNALLLALTFIETVPQKSFLMMTDSKSGQEALESIKTDHPTIV